MIDNLKFMFEVLISGGVLTFLWKGNRVLNRMWDTLQEYPPHRHAGTMIQYPKGMEPGKTVELEKTARV